MQGPSGCTPSAVYTTPLNELNTWVCGYIDGVRGQPGLTLNGLVLGGVRGLISTERVRVTSTVPLVDTGFLVEALVLSSFGGLLVS